MPDYFLAGLRNFLERAQILSNSCYHQTGPGRAECVLSPSSWQGSDESLPKCWAVPLNRCFWKTTRPQMGQHRVFKRSGKSQNHTQRHTSVGVKAHGRLRCVVSCVSFSVTFSVCVMARTDSKRHTHPGKKSFRTIHINHLKRGCIVTVHDRQVSIPTGFGTVVDELWTGREKYP